LKPLRQALKLLRHTNVLSHGLIGCSVGVWDLRASWKAKEGYAKCPRGTHWLVMTYIP
jgi:hypothetical protein